MLLEGLSVGVAPVGSAGWVVVVGVSALIFLVTEVSVVTGTLSTTDGASDIPASIAFLAVDNPGNDAPRAAGGGRVDASPGSMRGRMPDSGGG